MVQQTGAASLGEELRPEADEPPRRHPEVEPDPTGAVIDHLLHAALAQRHELRHHAEVVLRDLDRQSFDGLVQLAVHLPGDDLRLADRQLEALAPHRLDEHCELELTAPLDLPRVGALGRQQPERHVADQLLLEARFHLARRDLGAVMACERRRVDADRHRQARLVDHQRRERTRIVGVGQGLADGDLGDAGDRDDVARACLGRVDAIERVGQV